MILLTLLLGLAARGTAGETALEHAARRAENAVLGTVVDAWEEPAEGGRSVLNLCVEGRSIINGHPIEVLVSELRGPGERPSPALGTRCLVLYRWEEILPGERGNRVLDGLLGLETGADGTLLVRGPSIASGMPLGEVKRLLEARRAPRPGTYGPGTLHGEGCGMRNVGSKHRTGPIPPAPPVQAGKSSPDRHPGGTPGGPRPSYTPYEHLGSGPAPAGATGPRGRRK